MPTLSNGIVYQDLGTRDATEMSEYERKERERRRQTQQNANQPTAPTDGQSSQQPSTPAAPRAESNVGADPFAAVVQNRAAQDRNLGREDADLAYSQWKDTVDTAFSNGQAAARDKNKGVYNAGYTLWNTIESINNGEFDLKDENDKRRAQFMIQQAASQFGSVVAENHGWTLVDGNGLNGFSGFDGKNFNFYFRDNRTGNTILKSMSPQSLRKTLEKQGLVDKADDDPTKKVNVSERYAKDFAKGWDWDLAENIVADKTQPKEYRIRIREMMRNKNRQETAALLDERFDKAFDDKLQAALLNWREKNNFNMSMDRNVMSTLARQMNQANAEGDAEGLGAMMAKYTAGTGGEGGKAGKPVNEYSEFVRPEKGERDRSVDADEASARFAERFGDLGTDLDEKKSGDEGNLAKAWGPGQGGVNGDAETDPEVIELRRRAKSGTLTPGAAKRLADLTGDTTEAAKFQSEEYKASERNAKKAGQDKTLVSRFDALVSRYNDEDEETFREMDEAGDAFDEQGHLDRMVKQDRDREREMLAVVREMSPEQRQAILRERDDQGHFTERARRMRSALLYARDMGTSRRAMDGAPVRKDESENDREAEVSALAAVDVDEARSKRANKSADASETEIPVSDQDTETNEPEPDIAEASYQEPAADASETAEQVSDIEEDAPAQNEAPAEASEQQEPPAIEPQASEPENKPESSQRDSRREEWERNHAIALARELPLPASDGEARRKVVRNDPLYKDIVLDEEDGKYILTNKAMQWLRDRGMTPDDLTTMNVQNWIHLGNAHIYKLAEMRKNTNAQQKALNKKWHATMRRMDDEAAAEKAKSDRADEVINQLTDMYLSPSKPVDNLTDKQLKRWFPNPDDYEVAREWRDQEIRKRNKVRH